MKRSQPGLLATTDSLETSAQSSRPEKKYTIKPGEEGAFSVVITERFRAEFIAPGKHGSKFYFIGEDDEEVVFLGHGLDEKIFAKAKVDLGKKIQEGFKNITLKESILLDFFHRTFPLLGPGLKSEDIVPSTLLPFIDDRIALFVFREIIFMKDVPAKMIKLDLSRVTASKNIEEQYSLGVWYIQDLGIKENVKAAFKFFLLAAEQGHLGAKYNLGLCYQKGLGVEANTEASVSFFKIAAQKGSAEAQYSLALCYQKGLGVDKSLKSSAKYFDLAAKQGHADAQYDLGLCLQKGLGVAEDLVQSVDCFLKSAEQGHAKARSELFACFRKTKYQDVYKDLNERFCFVLNEPIDIENIPDEMIEFDLARAEESEDPEEAYKLGVLYIKNIEFESNVRAGFRFFKLASRKGHPGAQYNLGLCYQKGLGVEKSLQREIKYFLLAAKSGHQESKDILRTYITNRADAPVSEKITSDIYRVFSDDGESLAQFNLGVCFKDGLGVEKNLETAFNLFLLAAGQEHADAQYNLACCYAKGAGVEADPEKAVEFFNLAASQSDALAQNELGFCYLKGRGIEENSEEAHRLFKLSADQECSDAQYNLGMYYLETESTIESKEEAVRMFQLASDQGHLEAHYQLASSYLKGAGTCKNIAKSVHLFKRAADQGHVEAQYCLARCHLEAEGVEEKNPELAAELLTLAAAQGHAKAQYSLALSYLKGLWTPKDVREAVRLFALAAHQEHREAQYSLALCYFQGRVRVGGEKNYEEAVKFFKLAAAQDHVGAQYHLALCYKNGFAVEQVMPAETARLFAACAKKGHAKAQYHLGLCYESGEGVDKNPQLAAKSYALAAGKGNSDALHQLGLCHKNALGVLRNRESAFKYFSLAAEEGHRAALSEIDPNHSIEKNIPAIKKDNFIKSLDKLIVAKIKQLGQPKGDKPGSKKIWFSAMAGYLTNVEYHDEVEDVRDLCLALAHNDNKRARQMILELYKLNPSEFFASVNFSRLQYCSDKATSVLVQYAEITKQEPPAELVEMMLRISPRKKRSAVSSEAGVGVFAGSAQEAGSPKASGGAELPIDKLQNFLEIVVSSVENISNEDLYKVSLLASANNQALLCLYDGRKWLGRRSLLKSLKDGSQLYNAAEAFSPDPVKRTLSFGDAS